MSGFLETILAHKREEVAAAKRATPLTELRNNPLYDLRRRSLRTALTKNGFAVIAEVKKASPSKGVIRESFDHRTIADQYVRGGANALSVLTDEKFFQGKLQYLDDLRPTVNIPLLRKDFIIDSYQLSESRAHGADAILLIAAALEPSHLADLHDEALGLGLECLVEIHSELELGGISGIKAPIIGVNNRDLSSFQTDLSTSLRLRPLMPPDAVTVSESGISTAGDVQLLKQSGYHAVLVGEILMRSPDPGVALMQLLPNRTRT